MNTNQVSFTAGSYVYINQKARDREDFNKVMDSKIAKMQERKNQTNEILNYFSSPEGKAQLERIPQYDEVSITPIQRIEMEGDGEIDDSCMQLDYLECEQDGEYIGELKDDTIVPVEDAYIEFNEDNEFSIEKVKTWLDKIASYFEE